MALPYVPDESNGAGRRDTPGTHRPLTAGTFVSRGVNPLGRACPTCKARRYERCFEWKGFGSDKFLDVLPVHHSKRVPLYSAGAPVEDEEEDEEAQ